ncbi:protein chibby homolog 3 [Hemicordylus capensis]|uniref:protein chibby homolog 3 n=1 Tax=Hemicordylus capensis TaxID=884348 RepID=UPI0023047289|nr:protein chibby homolog 3 [Hemicordylus capensis]XP_053154961.1 protein chibby homolog 3 [Hemicordylus capensis]XP_053154962.1 protein chibby homolog 3 [Hemicordylus capensis]XP_053154963.1 protein chibby homolog 3 [Hemicordylus capensis]XP_053154964.1 protein chibby homolog 3 [Hemicordylus capensis]XP_053154965.1 protein chibby homolog 3 [Hemicordylus capensis]
METIAHILQDVRDYWADNFSRRFFPRRPTLRQTTSLSTFYLLDYKTRQAELGMDYGPPCAQLSKKKFVFQDGEWQGDSIPQQMPLLQLFSSPEKEQLNKSLKKANKALVEENNYLKLQLELLMDMLTETTARLHSVEKKMDSTSWHRKMKKTNKVLMLRS